MEYKELKPEERIVGINVNNQGSNTASHVPTFGPGTFVSYVPRELREKGLLHLGRPRYDDVHHLPISLDDIADAERIVKALAAEHGEYVVEEWQGAPGAGGIGGERRYDFPSGTRYRVICINSLTIDPDAKWERIQSGETWEDAVELEEVPFVKKESEFTIDGIDAVGRMTLLEDNDGIKYPLKAEITHKGFVYLSDYMGSRHGGLAVRIASVGVDKRSYGVGIRTDDVEGIFAFMQRAREALVSGEDLETLIDVSHVLTFEQWAKITPPATQNDKFNTVEKKYAARLVSAQLRRGNNFTVEDAYEIARPFFIQYAWYLTTQGDIEGAIRTFSSGYSTYFAQLVLKLCGQDGRADEIAEQSQQITTGVTNDN